MSSYLQTGSLIWQEVDYKKTSEGIYLFTSFMY